MSSWREPIHARGMFVSLVRDKRKPEKIGRIDALWRKRDQELAKRLQVCTGCRQTFPCPPNAVNLVRFFLEGFEFLPEVAVPRQRQLDRIKAGRCPHCGTEVSHEMFALDLRRNGVKVGTASR